MSRNPLQQQFQFVEAEGLGEVIIGAVLHGLHRRLDRAVPGHHHYDRIGTAGLDLMQRLEATHARQFQIEQNDVDAMRVDDAIGVLSGLGHERTKAEGLPYLAASFADGAFIVHNDQIQEVRTFDLSAAGCG